MPASPPLLLLIGGDAKRRAALRAGLRRGSCQVAELHDGLGLAAACNCLRPDLLLVDADPVAAHSCHNIDQMLAQWPESAEFPVVLLSSAEPAWTRLAPLLRRHLIWLRTPLPDGLLAALLPSLLRDLRSAQLCPSISSVLQVDANGNCVNRQFWPPCLPRASTPAAPLDKLIAPELYRRVDSIVTLGAHHGEVQRLLHRSEYAGAKRFYECDVYPGKEGGFALHFAQIPQLEKASDPIVALPSATGFVAAVNNVLARLGKDVTQLWILALEVTPELHPPVPGVRAQRLHAWVARQLQAVLGECGAVVSSAVQGAPRPLFTREGKHWLLTVPCGGGRMDIDRVLARLQCALTHVVFSDDTDRLLNMRVGAAAYPGDGKDADTLVCKASIALQHAPAGHLHERVGYRDSMKAGDRLRRGPELSLLDALDGEQLHVKYQPVIDLQRSTVCGMEALVRWQHPELGVLTPQELIPLAEETGLIVPIGEWLIAKVCAQLAQWRDAGHADWMLSVNISPEQLRLGNLVDTVARALHDHALHPARLDLELPESVLLSPAGDADDVLLVLKKMGVHISVNDLGMSYSSLQYLEWSPLDALKLDPQVVQRIARDPRDANLVRHMIRFAQSYGVQCMAKGIEFAYQAQLLRRLGCKYGQGFWFSRPMRAEECVRLLPNPSHVGLGSRDEGTRSYAGQ